MPRMSGTLRIARRRRPARGSRAVLLGALLASACGEPEAPPAATAERTLPPGAWSPVRGGMLEDEIERMRAEGLDWKQVAEEIQRLESIGYLAGTQSAPDEEGVTLHRADRAWQGLNLYVSGHGTEAILMDM